MNRDILEYKGYSAKIEFDTRNHTLFGRIEGINDLVTFESDSPLKIEDEFHSAVNDYLAFCEEVGKAPEKEYKGRFNVRIDPALHKKIAERALKDNVTLNAIVERAIAAYV